MDNQPILIDGSMGEGGGQILRTAIAFSAVLRVPVRIYNIRAKRRNPGLRPQHLTAVKAIAEITGGHVEGLKVGSMEIEFHPGRIRRGYYSFNIGTAGSISLLLQAVLPALAFAEGPVRLRVIGGTDVKMAPSIDYMRFVLARLLEKFGYKVTIRVLRRGHYPRGGGIVEVKIPAPPRRLAPVNLVQRGRLVDIAGLSHCVRLPKHVAERQARSASQIIERELGVKPRIELEYYEPSRDPHLGPGSGIALWALFERSVMGADALGERGKRAEIVGSEAALKLVEDIKRKLKIS
jgi:RNA 3'-terminal phosphate cyclase (ATP)